MQLALVAIRGRFKSLGSSCSYIYIEVPEAWRCLSCCCSLSAPSGAIAPRCYLSMSRQASSSVVALGSRCVTSRSEVRVCLFV